MKYILPILTVLILLSCQPQPNYLTQEQIELEKQKVKETIEAYHKASEDKDFGAIVETLADEVIFFGSDSSEVIKSFADFKRLINEQWEVYDKTEYGEISDLYIQMDNQATLASVIYGVPLKVTRNDIVNEYFLRVSRTLKKKEDNWYIVSGVVGIVRTQEEVQEAYNKEEESTENDSEADSTP